MNANSTRLLNFNKKIWKAKIRPIYIKTIIICCALFWAPLSAQAASKAVPTFNSIGLYWSPSNGSSSNECAVLYRKVGASNWNKALSLWFDAQKEEYRGSIVNLAPNSSYQIKMTLNSTNESETMEVSTWSETFPIGTTVELPEVSNTTLNINVSGTPEAYRLYTFKPGKTATINVNRDYEDNIKVDANYVIIRGLTLKNAIDSGIFIANNRHHIVIEDCDISKFGNGNWDGAIEVNWNSKVSNLVIQRNKIHDPAVDSNSWCEPEAASHPQGTNAISFKGIGSQVVIRYNSIYSSNNFFEDAIMYAETSVDNDDQDIYGNYITGAWDDCIQSEGSIGNVRIWANYIKNYHHAITSNPVNTGPMYIWRNISVPEDTTDWCNYNRGGLLKTTSNSYGRIYIINNTMLWNPNFKGEILGSDAGIGAGGNGMANTWSMNNIYQVREGTKSIFGSCKGDCLFTNDIYNGSISQTVVNGIKGKPTYAATPSYDLSDSISGVGKFNLSKSSVGYDSGKIVYNFNENYEGSAPDIGAHEYGAPSMEFGVTAYLGDENKSAPELTDVALLPPENLTVLKK